MARQLLTDQLSQVFVYDIARAESTLVFESCSTLVEAPNWSPDGRFLVVNADGGLYRFSAEMSPGAVLSETQLVEIDLDGVPAELNNDHVLAPDGSAAIVTARDGHLYSVDLDGARPAERLTLDPPTDRRFKHYLHGVSSDGATLALIGGGLDSSDTWVTNVYTMPAAGGPLTQLTDDAAPDDGVEFDPTGEWLYFNSERASTTPGHAQLFRMRPDGSDLEQLTGDDRVNWFPHVSPDGRWLVYLSYEPGTLGHPENLPVLLRLIDLESRGSSDIVTLFGGQGTTNVNGWSPDATRFAYVAYPVVADALDAPDAPAADASSIAAASVTTPTVLDTPSGLDTPTATDPQESAR